MLSSKALRIAAAVGVLATLAPAQSGQYDIVNGGPHAVCNEAGRINAPCGNCGPRTHDLEKCMKLCDQVTDCTHFTHFSDEGCRIYLTCGSTWNQKYGGGAIKSVIYQNKVRKSRYTGYEVTHANAGTHAVCKEDGRINADCGDCGPHSHDLGKCVKLCDQVSDCTHFTYFSDEGCRIYHTCDATSNQNFESGTVQSMIWSKLFEWKKGDEGTIELGTTAGSFVVVWDLTGIQSEFSSIASLAKEVTVFARGPSFRPLQKSRVRAINNRPMPNDGGRRLAAARSNKQDSDNDKIYNNRKGDDDAGLPIVV